MAGGATGGFNLSTVDKLPGGKGWGEGGENNRKGGGIKYKGRKEKSKHEEKGKYCTEDGK
jgi:hypothetical protein